MATLFSRRCVSCCVLKLSSRCCYSVTSGQSLDKVSNQLRDKSKKVVVLTGAGLSTASGVPDFRTPGTGLYSNLQSYNLPYPEAIFDLQFYRNNPVPFLKLAKELYPGQKYEPNIAHKFLRLLELKKLLLRVYTQNIDGLEKLAGVSPESVVEVHGSFSSASCIECYLPQDTDQVKEKIINDQTPLCSNCKGLVKPDIVFFGEQLPERFGLHTYDTAATDLMIVIGTSLQVFPAASLPDLVPHWVPRVLINSEAVGSFGERENDFLLLGDIKETVDQLITKLDWNRS